MNIQQVIQFAKDKSISSLDIKLTNLFGGMHHVTLPVNQLTSELFNSGIGIDCSSIPGLKADGRSDARLIPDPSTAVIDPFWDHPTLSFLGSVYKIGTKEPYPLDPRQVAIRAEKYLIETGAADESFWGPELEFYIFNNVSFVNEINRAYYRIDSDEADWSLCEPFLFTPIETRNFYLYTT